MEIKNTMEQIPEPFIACSFCGNMVNSKLTIRAKKLMIIGTKSYPPGTVICYTCLEGLEK